MTRLSHALKDLGIDSHDVINFPHAQNQTQRKGLSMGCGRAARIALSAFKTRATAYINFLADQYWVRIVTADEWYIEPPPVNSQMEAIHCIRAWAGDVYDVEVVLDLENESFSVIGQNEKRIKEAR